MSGGEKSSIPGLRAILAASNIGLVFVASILIGTGMGYWLDKKFNTAPWLLLFFMMCGVAAGVKNVYRFVKMSEKYEKQEEEKKK